MGQLSEQCTSLFWIMITYWLNTRTKTIQIMLCMKYGYIGESWDLRQYISQDHTVTIWSWWNYDCALTSPDLLSSGYMFDCTSWYGQSRCYQIVLLLISIDLIKTFIFQFTFNFIKNKMYRHSTDSICRFWMLEYYDFIKFHFNVP